MAQVLIQADSTAKSAYPAEHSALQLAQTPTASDSLPAITPDAEPPQPIVHLARTYLGTPYCMGSTGPASFDCSGFVRHVYQGLGQELPRDSRSQALLGEKIRPEEAQPGDLIFFKGRRTTSNLIGHVGIVTSEAGKELTMIHASRRGVVEEAVLTIPYYRLRLVEIRRM